MVSLGAVENKVKTLLGDEETHLVAVNIPDSKKGEKIVLFIEGKVEGPGDPSDTRSRLITAGIDNLMLPSAIYNVDEIPKLGTGKTDYKAAAKLADNLLAQPRSK